MVRIRMTRQGRRHRPFYRIQVQDARERRDGRFIEQIGWYDPLAADQSKQLKLDEERAKYWLGVGAQPSGTVRDILVKRSLIDRGPWEAERARRRKLVDDRRAAAAAAESAKASEAPASEG